MSRWPRYMDLLCQRSDANFDSPGRVQELRDRSHLKALIYFTEVIQLFTAEWAVYS